MILSLNHLFDVDILNLVKNDLSFEIKMKDKHDFGGINMIIMIIKIVVGAVIGGGLGYLYYKKVGCPSGTCPITSSRFGSITYGAMIGLMIGMSL